MSDEEKKQPQLTDPFPFCDVDTLIVTSTKDGSRSLVVFYINARAVMDRLDACGCDWSDAYTVLSDGKHVECRLTVNGVTRCDVGEPSEGVGDEMKGAYSGAFKRAAVKHGIGRYLYNLGERWVPTEMDDRGKVRANDATYKATKAWYIDAIGLAAEPAEVQREQRSIPGGRDVDPPQPAQERAEPAKPAQPVRMSAKQWDKFWSNTIKWGLGRNTVIETASKVLGRELTYDQFVTLPTVDVEKVYQTLKPVKPEQVAASA